MSRRKDRDRLLQKRRVNPDYAGFRGYDKEPGRPGQTPMQSVTCSVCGRRRNVAFLSADTQVWSLTYAAQAQAGR